MRVRQSVSVFSDSKMHFGFRYLVSPGALEVRRRENLEWQDNARKQRRQESAEIQGSAVNMNRVSCSSY